MSWTRKLSRQGNTFIMTIPKPAVENMGCRMGDILLCEQPISRSLIVTPFDAGNLISSNELIRAMGYLMQKQNLDQVCGRFAVQAAQADVECVGCHQHQATRWVRELMVCDFCMTEIGNAFQFRSRPSQTEMDLRQLVQEAKRSS